MRINFDEQEKILTLEIEEEIDHHMAGNLRREADYEIQRRNPKRIILDFNNVVFMDSAGIGMVIRQIQNRIYDWSKTRNEKCKRKY